MTEKREGAAEIEAAIAKIGKPEPEPLQSDLLEVVGKLEETEEELGLEYVGPGKGQNRRERRGTVRTLKHVTRRPEAFKTLRHPILDTLTPYGIKQLKKRRAKNKVARASRKRNR